MSSVIAILLALAIGGSTVAVGRGHAQMTRAGSAADIRVQAYPEDPLIERGDHQQYLNFDFGLENTTATPRTVQRIEMSVFDRQGLLVRRQFIWADGAASPGLLTAPDRTIPANGSLGLFNPFYALPPDLPLDRLRFTFIFEMQGLEPTSEVTIEVTPRAYRQDVRLVLPVDGPALVYDGHDFYSHHRRIPLGSDRIRRAGLTANPVRYANDFTPVGPNGELARGAVTEPTNWYGYGALVRAPGAGEVVSAANDVGDNRIEQGQLIVAPDSIQDESRQALGNHLIIKHREGVFSVLAHLKAGSVRVRVGDRVTAGQPVGEIGFSGDTGFHVHLHHMVTSAAEFNAEGLPAYFDGVRRVVLPRRGSNGPALARTRLDTGDLIERVGR